MDLLDLSAYAVDGITISDEEIWTTRIYSMRQVSIMTSATRLSENALLWSPINCLVAFIIKLPRWKALRIKYPS